MKKFIFCFAAMSSLICSGLFAQKSSPYFSRVIDYRPAPGQFINENYPQYKTGDDQAAINTKVDAILKNTDGSYSGGNIISLGAYGGYVILAFDEPIVNAKNSPYDFKVYGNAFVNNSEPGIVMVSYDANRNGIADDEWYELAGSEYARCQKGYEITYQKPNPLNGDVTWTDNTEGAGEIKRNNFHKQESYYPLWIAEDSLVFKGTLFPDSLLKKEGQWGYADNAHNAESGCNFKISWAIDSEGNSVVLPAVHFVKIYTAVNKSMGALGEISTEIQCPGIEDLHPELVSEDSITLEKNTLDPNKEYHILNLVNLLTTPETIWDKTFHYDSNLDKDGFGTCKRTFIKDTFLFHQETSDYGEYGIYWSGTTYSNKTDNLTNDYSNEFSAIAGRGVDSIGSTYLVAFDPNAIEFAEGKAYRIAGTYITNTTVGYYAIKEGNVYAKKFGGSEGTDPDWFKVTFTGIDEKGDTTGNIDFYLADFRFDNSEDDYIVKNWRWVDLSSLGKVAKIQYSFSSSDNSQWGMNTPAYFCMDKIAAEKHSTNTQLAWIKVDGNNIQDFDADKLHYRVHITDTSTIPSITVQTFDNNAVLDIVNITSINDTVKIMVTAEDSITTQLYTVVFTTKSSNANLAWIKVNEIDVPNFNTQIFDYTVELPTGTTNIPTVTAGLQDSNAKLEISSIVSLSDTVKIKVVPEDESNSLTYRVTFIVQTSTDDLAPKQIKVYPNPVQDYLYIENIKSSSTITIHNINGRMIFSQTANTSVILNSTAWEKGVYLLQIGNEKGAKSLKIVKE